MTNVIKNDSLFKGGASLSDGTWVPGIAVSDDSQPFIAADEDTLYWAQICNGTYGIFTAKRKTTGENLGGIHAIVTLTAPFPGKIALPGEAPVVSLPQGKLLYMMCGGAGNLHDGQTWHDADYIALKPRVARLP